MAMTRDLGLVCPCLKPHPSKPLAPGAVLLIPRAREPCHTHLFLGIHLQNIHQVDHDVFVCLLVLPNSEWDGEPARAPCAHEGLTALLLPFSHLQPRDRGWASPTRIPRAARSLVLRGRSSERCPSILSANIYWALALFQALQSPLESPRLVWQAKSRSVVTL